MAADIWLKPNRRILFVSALFTGLLALGTFAVTVLAEPTVVRILSAVLAAATAWLTVQLLLAARQPRLSYRNGQLEVYLRGATPIRVPIEVVECFFLGQGPSLLRPGGEERTANIVVRLAESAESWKQVEVQGRLGQWCDGYITIRGAWTEPIQAGLMSDLNKKLRDAHRAALGRNRESDQ